MKSFCSHAAQGVAAAARQASLAPKLHDRPTEFDCCPSVRPSVFGVPRRFSMRQQTTLRKPLTSPLCPPLPRPPPSVRPNPTPACKHCLGSIKSILCAGRASSDNSKGNHETNERRDTYELRLRAQARRRKSFLPAMLTRQKIESPGQITVRGREGPMPFHAEVRSRPADARRRGKYKSNPSQQKVEAVKYCLAVEFAVPLGIPSSIHYNIRHRRGGMGRLCSRARTQAHRNSRFQCCNFPPPSAAGRPPHSNPHAMP